MKRSNQEYQYITVVPIDESSFFTVILVLVGYDIGQPANRRIKMLLNLSLFLHLISLIAIFAFDIFDRNHSVTL